MNILIIRRLILHILIGLIFLLTINTNAFSCGWAGENDGDDYIETVAVGVDGNPVPDLDDDIEDPSFQNKIGNMYESGLGVEKNMKKNDTIFVMCRSGVRSALAGNLLYKAGFKNVYNVIDGFEGDT